MINVECPLLSISSPFSYIAQTDLVVLKVKTEQVKLFYDRLPSVAGNLGRKLASKLSFQTELGKQIESTLSKTTEDSVEKRLESKKAKAIQSQVEHHFPQSTPTVRSMLEHTYSQRMSQGRVTGVRGIATHRLRGGLTERDMVNLETVKRSCFLDYQQVDRFLDQSKQKERGESIKDPVRNVSLCSSQSFA